jgi:hypothetical protein
VISWRKNRLPDRDASGEQVEAGPPEVVDDEVQVVSRVVLRGRERVTGWGISRPRGDTSADRIS